MFVNREMINFEFGKVIEKVVFSCETSHQTSLVVEYLWVSDKALELGNPKVRGSISIQFLMGTQNFFFVPRSWQDEKTSLIIEFANSTKERGHAYSVNANIYFGLVIGHYLSLGEGRESEDFGCVAIKWPDSLIRLCSIFTIPPHWQVISSQFS